QVLVGVNIGGLLGVNINLPEPFDVDHALDVEYSHFSVPTKCHCSRWATFHDAVVEKLVVHLLSGNQRAGEKQFKHSGIGFDIMSQEIFNRRVPANLKSARPGTLDGHFRWRDHEEHVDKIAKAREQPA